jgi:hypothetical protein
MFFFIFLEKYLIIVFNQFDIKMIKSKIVQLMRLTLNEVMKNLTKKCFKPISI